MVHDGVIDMHWDWGDPLRLQRDIASFLEVLRDVRLEVCLGRALQPCQPLGGLDRGILLALPYDEVRVAL